MPPALVDRDLDHQLQLVAGAHETRLGGRCLFVLLVERGGLRVGGGEDVGRRPALGGVFDVGREVGGRGPREVPDPQLGEVVHQRELDGVRAVEPGLLAGEEPDQHGEMKGMFGDRLAVGDAAQEVAAARHAVQRLELEEKVEEARVGETQTGMPQGLHGRPAPSQPRDM